MKAIAASAVAQELGSGEIARAGYGADRRYLLSVHRGCACSPRKRRHAVEPLRCAAGRFGIAAPALRGEEAFVIGISTGAAHMKRPDAGYVALAGLGPSATSFIGAVEQALAR